MARPVTLGAFQRMQSGESDASGDREVGTQDVVTRDPLTGQMVDVDWERPGRRAEDAAATERLKALGCGELGGRMADRAEQVSAKMASRSSTANEVERVEAPDWREIATIRSTVVDVNADGTVADVRPAEMTPDRGDVTRHHAVTDERRFSGGGTGETVQQSMFLVPSDADFQGKAYRAAPELANIAEVLIGEHGFFEDMVNCDIRWYWKRKTVVSKGRVKIGFMKRASDLLGHFTGADFIGWLSATTARDGKFTDEQVRAAVFHQLCVPAGTEVTSPKVEAASARWYAGHLIEIGSASGHFLACTPNHPILTARGWVTAGLLVEGDHVLSSRRAERVSAAVDPDEYQRPAPIEEVARALGMPLPLVPPPAHNLHTDRLGGEVQVVTADGQLRRGFQAERSHHGKHLALGRRDAGSVLLASQSEPFERAFGVALAGPGFSRSGLGALQGGSLFGPRVAETLALGVASRLDARALQDALDNVHRDAIGRGERRQRIPRAVALHDGVMVECGGLPGASLARRLGGLPERNAGLSEPRANRWGADSADFSERLQGIPGGVALDEVVSLQRRPFSGHVYNLRTSQSWYSANGIIVHNCHVGSDDKGNWIFMPHDFEGFAQEVRVFGTWTENLKLGGAAFMAAHQMGLFDGTEDDDEEDGDEEGYFEASGEDVYDGNRYAGDGPDPADELDTLISAPRDPFVGETEAADGLADVEPVI